MTTPAQTNAQMPPLPVVAYRLPDLDIKSKHHYFDFNEVLNSSHLMEPLCKVSDAQTYAAQRCQKLETALREAQGELAARCAFGAADNCAVALNQTKEQP